MNGHIIPGTGIAVDYWKIRGGPESYIHFLTHLHGDHIVGLTSSWKRPIYCSQFTADMLHLYYGIPSHLISVTPVGQSILVKDSSSNGFTVTAIDADHCPGSVMFYFQGDFGNILYTGDFRGTPGVLDACQHLAGKVDTLYLDNTYSNPRCVFPSREECRQELIRIAKMHPDHDIIVGALSLGKEMLLAQLGVALDETVYVSAKCLRVAQLILETNVFATAELHGQRGRLRTMPMHQVTRKLIQRLNETTPTIALLPTALYTGLDISPFCREPKVFIVPYSDHSSYPELCQFVSTVKPVAIHPIVTSGRGPFGIDISDRTDMDLYKQYLSRPKEATSLSDRVLQSNSETIESCTGGHESSFTHQAQSKSVLDSDVDGKDIDRTGSQGKRRKKLKQRVAKRKEAKGVVFGDVEQESVSTDDPEGEEDDGNVSKVRKCSSLSSVYSNCESEFVPESPVSIVADVSMNVLADIGKHIKANATAPPDTVFNETVQEEETSGSISVVTHSPSDVSGNQGHDDCHSPLNHTTNVPATCDHSHVNYVKTPLHNNVHSPAQCTKSPLNCVHTSVDCDHTSVSSVHSDDNNSDQRSREPDTCSHSVSGHSSDVDMEGERENSASFSLNDLSDSCSEESHLVSKEILSSKKKLTNCVKIRNSCDTNKDEFANDSITDSPPAWSHWKNHALFLRRWRKEERELSPLDSAIAALKPSQTSVKEQQVKSQRLPSGFLNFTITSSHRKAKVTDTRKSTLTDLPKCLGKVQNSRKRKIECSNKSS
ncbi:5' exonuclease Apollo [Aplysia californica]|uniref:5' exonuclease Apollo n=1 Tax=Aplysia californica TaxID=6500 RepID=A0ABM0K0N0_APLCA|nr:5' exonuclease Apollo [Aplysia californica]